MGRRIFSATGAPTAKMSCHMPDVRSHWGIAFLPSADYRGLGLCLSGKLWHPAHKSAKTEKGSGVFGCGKPEEIGCTGVEKKTAVFESKALPDGEGLVRGGRCFPK